MVPNVVKGATFKGLMNYLLVGRENVHVLGGNMVGTNAQELTREFGMIRKLRPNAKTVVMHHSLSFADGEDPGDEGILKIAESYIGKMHLTEHQWVAVVHRDKAHVHVHLVVNRISLTGGWWNATSDWERAQVVAGKIEREMGLVEVPRPRLRAAIERAIELEKITPPIDPPKPPRIDHPVKHVMDTLRVRLESIPHGLSTPDWIEHVQALDIQLRPSIKGGKLSGFRVQLEDHHPVKISDVHRNLSWPKLVGSGRVEYDPELHFETVANLMEVPYDSPEAGTPGSHAAEAPERPFVAATGSFHWEWQPRDQVLVGEPVAEGLWADARIRIGSPAGQTPPVPGQKAPELGAPAPGSPGTTPGEAPAAGIWPDDWTVGGVREVWDAQLAPDDPGQRELLLGFGALSRSEGGTPGDPGLDAGGLRPGTRGSDPAPAPLGPLGVPGGGSLESGRVPHGPGDGRADTGGDDLGWRGLPGDARELIGTRTDYQDLGLPLSSIPQKVRTAAHQVIAQEEGLPHLEDLEGFTTKVLVRETLWQSAQQQGLSANQYRFAKGEIGKHLQVAREVVDSLTRQAKSRKDLEPPLLVLDTSPPDLIDELEPMVERVEKKPLDVKQPVVGLRVRPPSPWSHKRARSKGFGRK